MKVVKKVVKSLSIKWWYVLFEISTELCVTSTRFKRYAKFRNVNILFPILWVVLCWYKNKYCISNPLFWLILSYKFIAVRVFEYALGFYVFVVLLMSTLCRPYVWYTIHADMQLRDKYSERILFKTCETFPGL